MIKFTNIQFKNIMSYGNEMTEIDLTKAPLTVIIGSNGEGKSTLVDAITFALYGSAFRKVTKGNIVNNINNKEAYVLLSFEIKGVQFKVERGIKPDLFNIYRNGELLPQHGSVAQQQTFFEDEIIKMNKTMYTHQVMISKTSYTPFLELSTPDRREFNEYMLNLHIFKAMDKKNKENISQLQEELRELNQEKALIQQSLSSQQNHQRYISKIIEDKKREEEAKEKQVVQIQSSINVTNERIKSLNDELKSIQINPKKDSSELEKRLNQHQQQLAIIEHKGFEVAKELQFLETNDTCSSCNQMIFNKDVKIKEADAEKQTLAKEYINHRKAIIALQQQIKLINDENEENRMKAERSKSIRQQISSLKEKLKSDKSLLESVSLPTGTNTLEEDIKSLNEANRAIDEYLKQEKELEKRENDLLNLEHQYKIASQSLKDDGIKASVINEYIPFINEMMNKYLTQFGIEFTFNLDEKFNDSIVTFKGNKLTYNNLSEGQKQRVNLSMLMTWREVAKKRGMLYSNLLFLDEVFDSSLDQSGIDTFIEILETLEEMNIFVISHTPERVNSDRTLRVYREDSFSFIEEI